MRGGTAIIVFKNFFKLLLCIFSVFVFLFGLQLLRQGLKSITSHSLCNYLGRLVGSPLQGFVVGLLFTILWQSSSLTTVIAVSFTSAGLISFSSALGVVLGANLGTTFTERILVLQLPEWAPLITFAGLITYLFMPGFKNYSKILMGLGFLLSGFNLVTLAIRLLNPGNWIKYYLLAVEAKPINAIIWGAAATFFLQSSSAFMVLLLALAKENLVSLPGAILLLWGADIGTCATSLLAALHGNKIAKLVALSHLFFNVSSALFLYPLFNYFVFFVSQTAEDTISQIVNAHFIYNLLGALIFLPPLTFLAPYLDRLKKVDEK